MFDNEPTEPINVPQEEVEKLYQVQYFTFDNSLSADEHTWQEMIGGRFKDFEGNVKNAGYLMSCLGRGMEYVFDMYNKIIDGELPGVGIVFNADEGYPAFCYLPGEHMVLVNVSFLAEASQLSPETVRRIEDPNDSNTLVYLGQIDDRFAVIGIEEAAHFIYTSYIDKNYQQKMPHECSSLAEYDAQPAEFASIELILNYALDNELDMVEAVYFKRIKNARAFRNGQR